MRCGCAGAVVALASVLAVPTTLPAEAGNSVLEAAARTASERLATPGISIATVTREGSERTFAAGTTSLRGGAAVTPQTVFQLGSISKTLLAALIVQLAEEGVFALDDSVRDLLPGFDHLPVDVRVRALMNHTAGLRDLYVLPGALEALADLSKTREELADTVRAAPVDSAPGARWAYSNTHYTVLALLVEHVVGRPYEEVLTDRLFRPYRLDSLRACTSLPAPSGEAHGHQRMDGIVALAPPENMEWLRGDGGLCGSAVDVARAFHLLGSGRLTSASGYRQMARPAGLADGSSFPYGLGLALIRPDGAAKIAHNGVGLGFSASAAWYPDSGLAVAVLTNLGGVPADVLERGIARAMLGLPPPQPALRPATADTAADMIGTYDIGPLLAGVESRDGELWLVMSPPGPTVRLGVLADGSLVAMDDPEATQVLRPEPGTSGPCDIVVQMAAMHWCGVRR
jgi:D-alanyl-D-alanine carboxypeptidase